MPNLDMYISSLFEGVSEAPGFSWKAFQWTRAWTPVDRSAVSKLRLPTQQKGQTTSLIISTTARLLSAAAMAVARVRARMVVRALPLYAKCGDNYEPRVRGRCQRVPRIARALSA